MAYKQSPTSFIKHKSKAVGYMANGSAAHLEGDTDPNNETLVSSTTSRSRETTPSGIKGTRLTTESKFRTAGGEVKRTAEGDAAYTALSQEQREAQDAKFKAKQRSESQTRFTPDAIKMPKAGVESVKPKITTPDVNKEIYSKVFSPSENPNYGLRKKLYETARLKRYNDSRSGKITFEEAKAQSKPLKEMKKAMDSPEEIKQKQQERKVRKVKEAITSILPDVPKKSSYEKKLAGRNSNSRNAGKNPCKNC
jgi:hypothetical protein